MTTAPANSFSDRLPVPVRDETAQVSRLLGELQGHVDWSAVIATGTPWVDAVRRQPAPFWAMESLLREYPISSAEGLALMRLAEALLRVPDTETALALTADQLGRADFSGHAADGQAHPMLSGLASQAIHLSKKLLPEDGDAPNGGGLLQRILGVVEIALPAFPLGALEENGMRQAEVPLAEFPQQRARAL